LLKLSADYYADGGWQASSIWKFLIAEYQLNTTALIAINFLKVICSRKYNLMKNLKNYPARLFLLNYKFQFGRHIDFNGYTINPLYRVRPFLLMAKRGK
jgi:hypothetical protein